MASLALWILSAALLIGVFMGVRFVGGGPLSAPAIGAVHGLLGVSGLVVLVVALTHGITGGEYGVAPFGPTAAILGGLAVIAGLGIAFLRRRRTGALGLVVAVHACLAVTAYVLLLTYVALA